MASVAKIGRSKRSPSNKAYTSGKRWHVNRDKRTNEKRYESIS